MFLMLPWAEIQGKIEKAYDKIKSAYNNVEVGIGKVKDHKVLNFAVRESIRNIPTVGSYLLEWYDNAGGSEEDKSKQILEFLDTLKQQNEVQFNRISEDLKTNHNEIIKSNIRITELISRTSTEILEQTSKISEDTTAIKG